MKLFEGKEAKPAAENKPRPLGNVESMIDVAAVRPPGHGGMRAKMSEGAIRIGISGIDNRRAKHACLRLVFGSQVLQRLRWQKNDKVQILFDQEYLFIRRSNEGLYSLHTGKKEQHGRARLAVTLYPPMPHCHQRETIASHDADFIYQDDGILIVWPSAESK